MLWQQNWRASMTRLIVAAYRFCLVRASVRSRPNLARSMMGCGETRSSKLTARAETHRDRNGLTFPTSSPEQVATPERSLSRLPGGRLAEAEARAIRCNDSQLSGHCHARLLCTYAFGELHAPCSQNRPFFRDPEMLICCLVESMAHQLVTAFADISISPD